MSHLFLPLMFATGVTLHDLEEALWLPGWMRTHVKTVLDPNPKAYWVGTSLVSFVVWIATLAVWIWPTVPPFHLVPSGLALAMAVNAVVPLLSMSLIQRSYMPGTATGMLFNLPLAVLLIQAELHSRLAPLGVLLEAIGFLCGFARRRRVRESGCAAHRPWKFSEA